MSNSGSFDFKSFVMANAGKNNSGFDYVHAVYKAHGLAPDFILYFSKLFCPDFKVLDGYFYIDELFDYERYQELLNEGRSSSEVQFWMNLLEITGIFDGLSTDESLPIAESLASCWNAKLSRDFKETTSPARAICDNDTGEVYVTIGSPESE